MYRRAKNEGNTVSNIDRRQSDRDLLTDKIGELSDSLIRLKRGVQEEKVARKNDTNTVVQQLEEMLKNHLEMVTSNNLLVINNQNHLLNEMQKKQNELQDIQNKMQMKKDNKQCLLDTPRRVTVNNKRLISKHEKSEKSQDFIKNHKGK